MPVKLEPRNLFTPSIAMGTSNQTKEYQDNSIVELGKESYQDDSNDPKPGKPTAAWADTKVDELILLWQGLLLLLLLMLLLCSCFYAVV